MIGCVVIRSVSAIVVGLVLSGVAGGALAQETLYGVTDTSLYRIDLSDPGVTELVGPHGLAPTDLGGGRSLGAFSMTYDRNTGSLLGLYYSRDSATGIWDQFLVEYDQGTGAATIVEFLASSDLNGYVEAIEYVDGVGAVIISRDLDGTVTSSIEVLNGDGSSSPLIDNARDNDYAVYDQTRERFYVTDPNGVGMLSHVDLGTGITTDLSPIFSSTGDLAYCADTDEILAYVVGTRELVSLGDGVVAQLPVSLGLVNTLGVVQGLAVVSSDGGTPPCPADLNDDGYVDFNDIWRFIEYYLGDDLRADFNDDGLLDWNDIFRFIRAYLDGC